MLNIFVKVLQYSKLSSPLNDLNFAKLGEGQDKCDFYFRQIKNFLKNLY